MYGNTTLLGTVTAGSATVGSVATGTLPVAGIEALLTTLLGMLLIVGGMLVHRHGRVLAHQAAVGLR